MDFITLKDKKLLEERLSIYKKKLEQAVKEQEEALAFGDLSENEEYRKAKKDVKMYTIKIMEITEKLSKEVVATTRTTIDLGSDIHLRIENIFTGDVEFERDLSIVVDTEVSPDEGYLCVESPLFEYIKGVSSLDKNITGYDNVDRRYICTLKETSV